MRFLMFAAGAIVGSALTYFYVKDFYEKREDEIRAYYKKKNDPEEEKGESKEAPIETGGSSEVKEQTKPNPHLSNGFRTAAEYYNYSGETIREFSPSEDDGTKPYVITPDEYSEHVVSEVVYLTYYRGDGTLAGPDGSIYDIDSTVGRESIDRIGEYDPDVCYVRDLSLSTDYEITAKECSYSEDFGG